MCLITSKFDSFYELDLFEFCFFPSQFKGFIGVVISNNEFNSSSGRITLSKLTRTECYNNDKLKKRLYTERTHEYAGMQSHVGMELFLRHWVGCGYGFALTLHELKLKLRTTVLSENRDIDVAVPDAQAKWDTLSSEEKQMWEAGEIPPQAKLKRQDKGNVSGLSQATIRAKAAFRRTEPRADSNDNTGARTAQGNAACATAADSVADAFKRRPQKGSETFKDCVPTASGMQVTVASEIAVRLVPAENFHGDSRYCPAAVDIVRKVKRDSLTPGGSAAKEKDNLRCICHWLLEEDPAAFYENQESIFKNLVRSFKCLCPDSIRVTCVSHFVACLHTVIVLISICFTQPSIRTRSVRHSGPQRTCTFKGPSAWVCYVTARSTRLQVQSDNTSV